MEKEHKLNVESLREPIAHCACGRWTYLGISTEQDTNEALRARIDTKFEYHLADVEFEERRLRERAEQLTPPLDEVQELP